MLNNEMTKNAANKRKRSVANKRKRPVANKRKRSVANKPARSRSASRGSRSRSASRGSASPRSRYRSRSATTSQLISLPSNGRMSRAEESQYIVKLVRAVRDTWDALFPASVVAPVRAMLISEGLKRVANDARTSSSLGEHLKDVGTQIKAAAGIQMIGDEERRQLQHAKEMAKRKLDKQINQEVNKANWQKVGIRNPIANLQYLVGYGAHN